jgi:hypothetical protein
MKNADLAAWLEDQAASVRGGWSDGLAPETEPEPDPQELSNEDLVAVILDRLTAYRNNADRLDESCGYLRGQVTTAESAVGVLKEKIRQQAAQIEGFRRQLAAYVERLER